MKLGVEPPSPRDSKNLQGMWAEHQGNAQAIPTVTLERSERRRHEVAARLPRCRWFDFVSAELLESEWMLWIIIHFS